MNNRDLSIVLLENNRINFNILSPRTILISKSKNYMHIHLKI